MAERKGSLIAKSVSKHAGRAKEKGNSIRRRLIDFPNEDFAVILVKIVRPYFIFIDPMKKYYVTAMSLVASSFHIAAQQTEAFLQNLGKVDRTADDIFDEHLENFNRQQLAAGRLQKEFNNYIRCIRAVQGASKSLYDCINDVYESGWVGQDVLYSQSQNIEMLWQDLSHKLADQVLLPLNTYYSQFPEMRKKIDKRARKLVDYDGQRHNMQSLEGGGGKKRDEAKIQRVKEQLQMAKRTYDTLNSELHDDLPALHHSRILFFVNNLQTLFSAEQVFHSETSKVFNELEAIIDKLAMDTQKQSYSPRKITSSPTANNISSGSPGSPSSAAEEPSSDPESSKEPETPSGADLTNSNQPVTNGTSETPVENGSEQSASESSPIYENQEIEKPTVNGNDAPSPTRTAPATEANNNKRVEELYDIPVGATTENLPPGVLYKVKATYRYNREDVDELSFEVGDVIRVVTYDDPEEQEEGWLMGIKETTGEKGMFPANFTRPL